MSISLNLKKHFILLISLLFITMSILPVFAKENIISSVVISKAKDKQNAYELNIDSSKVVDYKTDIDSDGNIYFDLKNSVLAENSGTVYDDVVDIDNVMVKQLDRNRVRIYIKGQYAKNTKLVFVNSLFETAHPKKIVINRPINEYKSTSGIEDDDLENRGDDIQEWNDNSFNLYHFISETLSGAKESAMGIILIIVSIFVFIFIAIKSITSKISQDAEPLIGLNNTKTFEDSRISDNIEKIKARELDFNNISNRNAILKNAQEELKKAHNKYQEYLQNKYKSNSIKSKAVNNDVLKTSIALNQYKKNEKNPYAGQEVIKMDKINSYNINQGIIPPKPKRHKNNTYNYNTSPYIQKPSLGFDYPKNTTKTNNNDNTSSLKFLESVSKIYEQSGREDLAIGLKKSIIRK